MHRPGHLVPYESDGDDLGDELPIESTLNKDRFCRGFGRVCSAKAKHAGELCGHCYRRKQNDLRKCIEEKKKKLEDQYQEAVQAAKIGLELQRHEEELRARWRAFDNRYGRQLQRSQVRVEEVVMATVESVPPAAAPVVPAPPTAAVPFALPAPPAPPAAAPGTLALSPAPGSVNHMLHRDAYLIIREMRTRYPQGMTVAELRATPLLAQFSDNILAQLIAFAYNQEKFAELEHIVLP